MTALQVGAPGERHFGTVKKCYPCCRIKVLPMLPVDQRKPVLSQGAERFFISQIGFSAPCYCNGPLISCVKASCHPEPTEQREPCRTRGNEVGPSKRVREVRSKRISRGIPLPRDLLSTQGKNHHGRKDGGREILRLRLRMTSSALNLLAGRHSNVCRLPWFGLSRSALHTGMAIAGERCRRRATTVRRKKPWA